jgi:hypothetical protein
MAYTPSRRPGQSSADIEAIKKREAERREMLSRQREEWASTGRRTVTLHTERTLREDLTDGSADDDAADGPDGDRASNAVGPGRAKWRIRHNTIGTADSARGMRDAGGLRSGFGGDGGGRGDPPREWNLPVPGELSRSARENNRKGKDRDEGGSDGEGGDDGEGLSPVTAQTQQLPSEWVDDRRSIPIYLRDSVLTQLQEYRTAAMRFQRLWGNPMATYQVIRSEEPVRFDSEHSRPDTTRITFSSRMAEKSSRVESKIRFHDSERIKNRWTQILEGIREEVTRIGALLPQNVELQLLVQACHGAFDRKRGTRRRLATR